MDNVQKDLVLSINEFAYVLDETKGNVSCWVGPVKTSLSNSDRLVRFNRRSKKFERCSYDNAISIFTTAPENWYVILKNPAEGNKHPNPGTANSLPEGVNIGRKINICGPVSFALYPGQMAQVVKGHALRSNQYLLARVYEANQANINKGEILDANGNKIEDSEDKNYVNGQILVIKGTEVSFYIPPTGIEVIPIENEHDNGYVRDAVTLERLEYCILKDEDGNKRYVHGPKVVFPEPTETFVSSPTGGYIFRAIELSKISGIYAKVIAEYTDKDKQGNEIVHPVGEELFITGNDQMIYYPRPEHAIISYDGKMMHHAIAIPKGEGRYIMNRLTGEIKTIYGPSMYLPDPRTEVVVKRKLTRSQCTLWYPGNEDVLNYNLSLTEKTVEKSLRSRNVSEDCYTAYATSTMDNTLASLEAKANISRGTSYTKPRTITLDNKYDGVVSIDVWTGYAVNVVSKTGERKVVTGPCTVLLDYDQTLEVLEMSTGKPKTTDHLMKTVYLRHKNNIISDIINIETSDLVTASIKVCYNVSFDDECSDKWFFVENYVKFLCDRCRSIVKEEAHNYTIEEFYQNYTSIVKSAILEATNEDSKAGIAGRYFPENGMYIYDCEVLSMNVQSNIQSILEAHQEEVLKQTLDTKIAEQTIEFTKRQAEINTEEYKVKSQLQQYNLELQREEALKKYSVQADINRQKELEAEASARAEVELQTLKDAIAEAKRKREQQDIELALAKKAKENELEEAKMKAYTAMVKEIMESVTPDLVAAMNSKSNADLTAAIMTNISPYALAGEDETVTDVTTRLVRGTPLEAAVKGINLNV